VRLPEGSRAPEAPGFYAVIQYDRLPQGGIDKVGPPRASDLSGPYDITGGPASHPDDLREDWFTGVPVNEWPDFSDDKSPRYPVSRLGTLRGFPRGNPRTTAKAWHGRSHGKTRKDFPPRALAQGTRHELEHTKSRALAERIAMDHLAEDPRYYEKLANCRINPRAKKATIEYGAVRNKRGPEYGWLPVIWAYGRERGDTYAKRGFEKAEALARARIDAIDFAKGDPDATIIPRKTPHENPAKKAAKVPKARRTRAATKPQDRARARRAAKRPPPRARAPRARRAREPQGPPLELARKTTTHVYTVRKENPAHRSDLYNGRRRVGAGPVVNLRPNPTPLELRPRWIALRTGGKMSERARELTRGQTGVYAIREAAGGPILYIGEAHEAHPTELRRPKRKKGQRTRPPAVRRPQPLRWWKTITRHLYPWEWHYDPRDPRSEHNKRPDEWVYRGNHDLEISIWPTTPGQAKTVEGRLILEHRPKHSRKLELPAAEVDELEAAGELEEAPF
jgi:hypothetical protein